MQYEYFPVTISQLGAEVSYHDLMEGSFEVEGVRVKTHYLNHTVLTLGYRLEAGGVSIAYITDHEPFDRRMAVEGYQRSAEDWKKNDDDRHVDFFSGVDLLLHDCQYTANEYGKGKNGWGHSTVEYVVDVAIAAGVKQLAIFHHDPNRTDDQVDELLQYARERAARAAENKEGLSIPEIYAAAEGLVVDLKEGSQGSIQMNKGDQNVKCFNNDNLSRSLCARRKNRNIEGETVVVGLDCSTDFDEQLTEDLEKDKLKVELCKSFDDILKVSKQRKPSVLVMNQIVPGGGGSALDICKSIRNTDWGADVSFLVVAKNQDEMEMGRAESNIIAADDWITEPLSAAYIRTRVRMSLLRAPCRWKRAPIPKNEKERLATLHDSCILDVNHPYILSRIGSIARQLFDLPIVCFCVLDESKVKFIAVEGVDGVREAPRDASLCAHVVYKEDILIVNDAREDDRFADNPNVIGPPFLRFYAGVPITVKAKDGRKYSIGAMSLIDKVPRNFNLNQLKAFLDISAMVDEEFGTISQNARMKRVEDMILVR